MAGCLSPAFLVDDAEIVKRVLNSKTIPDVEIVILNGSIGLEADLQPAISKMVESLDIVDFENYIYKIFEGDEHNESAWAKQVEVPLLYFFGKD